MLDDKDVEKLIGAFKEVFPTAEMVQEGFAETAKKTDLETLATKDQIQKLDERLKMVEQKLEDTGNLRPRVKKLEEALEI